MKKKIAVSAIALVLVLCCAIGGTLAWLSDKTDSITNTFTVGNVKITLDETTGDSYKMIPGDTLAKDPKVTVLEGSEDCYLFVKVEKSENFDQFMTYAMAEGWTKLEGVDGVDNVYYRTVTSDADVKEFSVLANDQVTVLDTVTKEMMDAIEDDLSTAPTLTFTAYAVQSANVDTPQDAWSIATTGNLPVEP